MMTADRKQQWKTEKKRDIFRTKATKNPLRWNRNELKMNNNNKSLLRFTTAGSVDDGKSTLIGRLLYDSKSIFEDQLEHIERSGKRLGRKELDLSLLTDGLRAEREQGITIDVAYRYFATPLRKFIIADTPGHIQYTRNMVTGASTADLAIILIDARKGVLEQTIRHSYIASLLDIRHIIFCINKMDMVNWSEQIFLTIKHELERLASKLAVKDVRFIPISAKYGDNVVTGSENMEWYKGEKLLRVLETIEVKTDKNNSHARFPVQTVIRPATSEFHDYRGYAGRVAGGSFRTGDMITVLPSGRMSKIKSIDVMGRPLDYCNAGDSVSILLEDDIDISRGDILTSNHDLPETGQEITLMTCWFSEQPLKAGGRYLVRTGAGEAGCIMKEIKYKVNINSLDQDVLDREIKMNDIACITIKTSRPLFYDSYRKNNITGSMIFIDEGTNETIAAGMVI